ncbi:MAG: hypothetical protein ACLP0J_25290 [Solirubrobacteraceae bacterium]
MPIPSITARFPERAWVADLKASTPAGVNAAQIARRRYTTSGVPLAELRRCTTDARVSTTCRTASRSTCRRLLDRSEWSSSFDPTITDEVLDPGVVPALGVDPAIRRRSIARQ